MMNLPKFTAESSLGKPSKSYQATYSYDAFSGGGAYFPSAVLPSQIDPEMMGLNATEDMQGLADAESTDVSAETELGDEMAMDEGVDESGTDSADMESDEIEPDETA